MCFYQFVTCNLTSIDVFGSVAEGKINKTKRYNWDSKIIWKTTMVHLMYRTWHM